MNYKTLAEAFSRLESVGFIKRPAEMASPKITFESPTHIVAVSFLDLYATVQCDIHLKTDFDSPIDAYSAISYFNPAALSSVLVENLAPTSERLAAFICDELVGASSEVFRVTDPKAWANLFQHHRRSMQRRNRTFWIRVSGHADAVGGAGVGTTVAF